MHAITIDDVVKPYLHLPTAIQQALMRVETHPIFRTLTKSTLLVLKTLVSRASAREGTSVIRARVDRMAAEAGVSEKTIQRAIRCFRERGWIQQAGHDRSEWGVYVSRRYVLTPELCDMVELPTTARSKVEPAQRTEMSDGAIYVDLSYKKDLQEISIKNREGKPPVLPESVAHIPHETGLLETGVCKLLGIARKAGHQLADVYAVAKPYLAKIGTTPARAFRYLLAMLLTPRRVDYTAKAQQLNRTSVPAQIDPLAAIAIQCRFKRFVHVNTGMQVRFFEGSAEVSRDGHYHVYAGEQMAGLYRGIANGNLREIVQ